MRVTEASTQVPFSGQPGPAGPGSAPASRSGWSKSAALLARGPDVAGQADWPASAHTDPQHAAGPPLKEPERATADSEELDSGKVLRIMAPVSVDSHHPAGCRVDLG